MSDLLKRIADYFANDYQGDDKTAPTMEITVNDLRYIANMNVEICRAEAELRNLKYNKCKDCAGCTQCKTDEANAIQQYVDKVVKELEKELSLADKEKERCTGKNHLQFDSAKGYASGISTAIEIVKQGGISDDVCEWIKYDYRTICPKNHDANNQYWRIPDNTDKLKYCPYCGKKIKVVE